MKKSVLRFLSLTIILLSLCLAVHAQEADFIGEWRCITLGYEGNTYIAEEVDFEVVFNFCENGVAEFTLNGETETASWRVENDALMVTSDDGDYLFTVVQNTLKLEDGGIQMSFARVTAKTDGGQTEMRYSVLDGNGTKYPGKYTGSVTDGKPQDMSGIFEYDDGRKYVGGWENGVFSGQGTLYWSDGSVYTGEWRDGLYNGQGTFTWADGDTYIGEFKDNIRDGQGTFIWSNGMKYTGGWKEGLMAGCGTLYDADGSITQQGEWEDGELVASADIERDTAQFVPSGIITAAQEFDYMGMWRLTSMKYKGYLYYGEQMNQELSFLLHYYDNAVYTKDGNSKNIRWNIQDGVIIADLGGLLYRFMPDGEKLIVIDEGIEMAFERDLAASVNTAPWGSAKRLEGRSLLVSIFLTLDDHDWSGGEIAEANEKLKTACEYLRDKGIEYGKDVELTCDIEVYPDLRYDMRLAGSIYEAGDDDNILTMEHRREADTTYDAIVRFIEENIPYADLATQYQTDSIAYIVHVNKHARSYAMPYTLGYSKYIELTVVFNDSPFVYAHEILHLFGAIDLYRSDDEFSVTAETIAYVQKNFPDEVMLTNYGKDGMITNDLSRITALGLGWVDYIPELERFPELKANIPGAFTPRYDDIVYKGGDFEYNVDGGKATITKYLIRFDDEGDLLIPDTLDGYPVTGIEMYAFESLTKTTGIIIPAGIIDLDRNPFYRCASLTRFDVSPDNPMYTQIDGALYDKNQKTLIAYPGGRKGEFTIPWGVENIGYYAFAYGDSVAEVVIPDSVKTIGHAAFHKNSGLIGVTVPNSVKSIPGFAFNSCPRLEYVVIPSSVTEIGNRAFEHCPLLTLAVTEGSYAEKYAQENGLRYVNDPALLAE